LGTRRRFDEFFRNERQDQDVIRVVSVAVREEVGAGYEQDDDMAVIGWACGREDS
jgi:hypothetical protein